MSLVRSAAVRFFGRDHRRIELEVDPFRKDEALQLRYAAYPLSGGETYYVGHNKDKTVWSFCIVTGNKQGACGGRLTMQDGTIQNIGGAWSSSASSVNSELRLDDPLVEVVIGHTVYHTTKSLLDKFGVPLQYRDWGNGTGYYHP